MAMRDTHEFDHARRPVTGVLLINVGTPSSPTPAAVRSYLRQFLSDPRVIERQGLRWKFLLHGLILRTRPRVSAAAYKHIWTAEGSPLLVVSVRQAKALEAALSRRCAQPVRVEVGMGYGSPSVDTALGRLWEAGCDKLLAFPLYPQYAAATVGSALDAVAASLAQTRWIRPFRFVSGYPDHPAYLEALAESLRETWLREGKSDRLLLSFHGLPRATLAQGDPYHCQCFKTARLLWDRLGVTEPERHLAFQSRFGQGEWLKPYADELLAEWGRSGVATVDVLCPGFAADCLETLEEIGDEYAAGFRAAGGTRLRYIPALNDRPAHIEALADIAQSHLGDWGTSSGAWDEAALDTTLQERAERARHEKERGLNV